MTPSTPAKRLRTGSMTIVLKSWCGLLSLLISIQLSTFGESSKGSSQLILRYPRGWRRCGRELRSNGSRLGWRSARKLIESMPARVKVVLKAKGGYTKY